ncbi:MAG TPA: IPT/TIG domain-containing protein [Acidimicrobiales bacterium]|nr:IPT/TIG domain-containing protein [Acidimicrobiales bacterium]
MGEASRRVRESNSGVASAAADVHEPPSTGGDGANSRPPIAEAERPTDDGSGSELVHHDLAFGALTGQEAAALRQRRIRRLTGVGLLCGAVLAIAVVALNAGGGSGSSRTNAVARTGAHPSTTSPTRPTAPPPAPTSPPSTRALQPAPTAPVPTTTTLPPPPATTSGGGPELSSITPAQGTAGQTVVVSGTNLKSSDGQVLARFNGQPAGTSCPAPTSCTLTVPAISGAPSSVTITVTTAAGTSNSLAFSYG